MALRHCSLDEAFIDIVQTAKRHNLAPMGLAGALVAIAENDVTRDFDDEVLAAVGQAWGAYDADRQRAQQVQPTRTCISSGAPKLIGRQR